MINIVHSLRTKPEIKIQADIHAPDNIVYFIPSNGFAFDKVYHFQVTFYPNWAQRLLKIFGVKGTTKHFKGYEIKKDVDYASDKL